MNLFHKILTKSSFKYFIYGGLSYILISSFTYFFEKQLHFSVELSYGVSQFMIFFINLLAARYFIFNNTEGSITYQGLGLLFITLLFRGLDWFLYSHILSRFIQDKIFLKVFLSMGIILPIKYVFTKYIFNKKKEIPEPST